MVISRGDELTFAPDAHVVEDLVEELRIAEAVAEDDVPFGPLHVLDEALHVARGGLVVARIAAIGDDHRDAAHRNAVVLELRGLGGHGAERHERFVEQRRTAPHVVVARIELHLRREELVRVRQTAVELPDVHHHAAGLLAFAQRLQQFVHAVAHRLFVALHRVRIVEQHVDQQDLGRFDVVHRHAETFLDVLTEIETRQGQQRVVGQVAARARLRVNRIRVHLKPHFCKTASLVSVFYTLTRDSWLLFPARRCGLQVDAGPRGDGRRAVDDLHARALELLERRFGVRRVVHVEAALAVRHRHRRHAVAQDVHLGRERRVLGEDLVEEVLDRALHAVTGRLTADDQRVRLHQLADERDVALRSLERQHLGRRARVGARHHFGLEHGVVLGEEVVALHLEPTRAPADVLVEQHRFRDHADQVVAGRAEEAVRRPERQRVLALLLELPAVVLHVLEQVGVVALEPDVRDHGARPVLALLHVRGRDLLERERLHRVAVLVFPRFRGEDLERPVGVERRVDLADQAEVAVEELDEANAVVDRATAAPATDEERPLRIAEVVLVVDAKDRDDLAVAAHGREVVVVCPLRRARHELGRVRVVVPVARVRRLEEVGDRELRIRVHSLSFSASRKFQMRDLMIEINDV